jgi:hypothetical protein
MPKNITITLPDGRKHTYEDVPDNVTQEQAQSRAAQEFAPRPIQAGSPQAAASTHSVATQPSEESEERGPTPFIVDKDTGNIRDLTGGEKLRYGFGLGARNIALNTAEMLGLTSPERVKKAQAEGQFITGKFPGNVGSFAGETAALLPVGMGVGGATVRGGMAARGVLAGLAEGGVQGAIAGGPDDRLSGAALGAVTGGALPSAAKMAKLLGQGMPQTANARRLTRRGVELTPGQMNPEGNWAMMEEVLQGVPVIGPKISKARSLGKTQTQNVIAQEAAPPGVVLQPRQDPQDMFRDLLKAYDTAYEVGKGYPMLPVIRPATGPDVPLAKALQVPPTARGTDEGRKYAASVINDELSSLKGLGAKLSSDDLFAMRSRIRAEVRSLRKKVNAPLGADDILSNAEQRITAALDSQLPPNVVQQIRAIDAKYGNFKIIENALYRATDRTGGFTPSQFSQAVREGTTSRMGYAAGGGRMRDLSRAALDVFQPRQPATGRQMAALLATGGAAMFGGPATQAAGAGILGMGALPYLSGGVGQASRRVLTGQTQAQQAIRAAERAARRTLSPQERESIVRLMQTMGVAAQNQE